MANAIHERSDNVMILQKTHWVKILLILLLLFIAVHLWISFHRAVPGYKNTGREDDNEWFASNPADLKIGVDEESLSEFAGFDRIIDSLLTEEYNIAKSWIKSDPVQYDNLNYIRKVVQIPTDFSVTLFNTDLKEYADRYGWRIYNVQENIKNGDLTADIGKGSRIYQHLQLMLNRRLKSESKSFSILISGFGLSYDDMTRAFIDLPESITLVVPKGQEYSKIIAYEARRSGKTVIQRIPDQKNIIRFEAADRYDSAMISDFYATIQKAGDREAILFYEKKAVLELLTNELPKLPKKGYRIINYAR
jgi:hypothetical protein